MIMQTEKDRSLLSEWSIEIDDALLKSNSLCVALFSTDSKLLFSNEAFSSLVKGEPCQSFLNPSFDELLSLEDISNPIFDGFLTFGDYQSVNHSIAAQIFKKNNKLLVIGGVDTSQLLEQNSAMHQLNREVVNLQRDLIKKSHNLENTLSQLQEANLELNKLNADKDRFMQIVGHDLRSPFTTLLGFSAILLENLRTYDIDKIESMIELIHKTSQQTFYLLDDLLIWSKSQAGRIPFEPRELIFEDVCMQVINSLTNNAEAKNIRINLRDNEKTVVYADEQMLKTVLRNLLSNAIKFSHQNGQIDIYTEKSHSETTITVSDNGVGIENENIDKILDITQHYVTNGTAKEKGTGLGLMLCNEFVEKHGGIMSVESEPGKGSRFHVTMPFFQ